jgi:hypothetical protein
MPRLASAAKKIATVEGSAGSAAHATLAHQALKMRQSDS